MVNKIKYLIEIECGMQNVSDDATTSFMMDVAQNMKMAAEDAPNVSGFEFKQVQFIKQADITDALTEI